MEDKVPKKKEKSAKKKKGVYVPKTKHLTKKYKVILVKKSTIIVSVNGNGFELSIDKYPNVSIGDEVEVEV